LKLAKALSVGDKFRPAHPEQPSLNGRTMSRDLVHVVTKVFSMAPHTVVCTIEGNSKGGFYTIPPGTPVLSPSESDPTVEEIGDFLLPKLKVRKRVIGFRVLWDGKLPISGLVSRTAEAAVRAMFAVGRSEYSMQELDELFEKYYEKFLGFTPPHSGRNALRLNSRKLVMRGLLEEISDDISVPQELVDANLQGVL
jgi:hypothetical protein